MDSQYWLPFTYLSDTLCQCRCSNLLCTYTSCHRNTKSHISFPSNRKCFPMLHCMSLWRECLESGWLKFTATACKMGIRSVPTKDTILAAGSTGKLGKLVCKNMHCINIPSGGVGSVGEPSALEDYHNECTKKYSWMCMYMYVHMHSHNMHAHNYACTHIIHVTDIHTCITPFIDRFVIVTIQ